MGIVFFGDFCLVKGAGRFFWVCLVNLHDFLGEAGRLSIEAIDRISSTKQPDIRIEKSRLVFYGYGPRKRSICFPGMKLQWISFKARNNR